MLILDPHIHFHRNFDETRFFRAVKSNFKKYAAIKGLQSFQSVLCFTESAGVHFFQKLSDKAQEGEILGELTLASTHNKNVVSLKDGSGFTLFCIAGRQIVTKENLEILALGMLGDFTDGLPIHEVIQTVIDEKCLPVLPWGFGKWTGERGRLVKEIISSHSYHPFFLGDNGNRPQFMKMPSLLEAGITRKMINLQGSDPLPFTSEIEKGGSFGVIVQGDLDEKTPFDSLYAILTAADLQVEPFGELESPMRFLKNQITMQIVKRLR